MRLLLQLLTSCPADTPPHTALPPAAAAAAAAPDTTAAAEGAGGTWGRTVGSGMVSK